VFDYVQQPRTVHPQVDLLAGCIDVEQQHLIRINEAVSVILQQSLRTAVCVRLEDGPNAPGGISQAGCR